jgi:hypothetical protein
MKQCSKCKEIKAKSEFSKRNASKDGLQARCISCRAVDNRERAERNKAKNADRTEFPEFKRCPTCSEIKAGSAFDCNSNTADGLHGRCKSCMAVYKCEQRELNKLKNADQTEFPELKRCPACGETKAGSEFCRDSTRPDGLQSQCKPCNAEYKAEYHAANKLNFAVKSGYKKAVALGNHAEEFTGADLEAHWLANDISKDHCHYCQVHFGALEQHEQQIDHVHALNTGGPHTVENIVPCCISCNSAKHDKPLEQFLAATS